MSTDEAPELREWVHLAAQRISRGSGRLAEHLARRAVARGRRIKRAVAAHWEGASGRRRVTYIALLVVAARLGRRIPAVLAHALLAHHGRLRWLIGPAALAWLIAAWRIGGPDWQPKAERESDDDAEDDVPEDEADDEPEDAVEYERPAPPSGADIVAAVHAVGTPHAHLSAVAAHLGVPAGLVRAACGAAGIPVRDVRMRGRGASTGIHADDIPSPPPGPCGTHGDVVGAGHTADNDNNDSRTVRIGEAAWIDHPAGARHEET